MFSGTSPPGGGGTLNFTLRAHKAIAKLKSHNKTIMALAKP